MLCLSGFELYSRWVPLTNVSALNTAEGKKQTFLILIFLFIPRDFDLS